jgi:hypothetical protein
MTGNDMPYHLKVANYRTIRPPQDIYEKCYGVTVNSLAKLAMDINFRDTLWVDGLESSLFTIVSLKEEAEPDFSSPRGIKTMNGKIKFDVAGFTLNVTGKLYVPENYTSDYAKNLPQNRFQIVASPSIVLNSLPYLESLEETILLIPNGKITELLVS